ncbi:hypothetical protein DDT52_18125 [Brenneria roseae subsp. roseae]|uniref:lysozyme inhibitor LprI family protein n=1 Tax=Brenneria roseae TaxID=1509241 RepID=UPI000D612FE6|nr:lysozyme inhibitor LprI family protein [Brenneria roseae]PWC16513.1 hypothetical protein DDT52_18125 [Brenneria roseae subsp. roseae]
MRIVSVAVVFFFLISFGSWAKTSNDYLKDSENGICKDLIKGESYHEIYNCAALMENDSRAMLVKRISEIKVALEKMNNKEITDAFIREQRSWEVYKKDRCSYVTLGIDKNEMAYQFNLDICNAIENYRRIETLYGEPSFP